MVVTPQGINTVLVLLTFHPACFVALYTMLVDVDEKEDNICLEADVKSRYYLPNLPYGALG